MRYMLYCSADWCVSLQSMAYVNFEGVNVYWCKLMSWSEFPGSALDLLHSRDETRLPRGDRTSWHGSFLLLLEFSLHQFEAFDPSSPGLPLFCELSPSTGFASVTRCKALVTEAVSIATVQAPRSVRSPPLPQGQKFGISWLLFCTSGHTSVT
jgi:hypothetical protein